MFRLTNKLAVSNLIKNRKLYYPFALAVILAVTISYLFDSLTFNPNLQNLQGASTVSFTLGLGLFVVTIAAAIIVLYANSFVMKNRSKELGIYGMLGLEKRHLFSMVFKELFLFGLVTVIIGIGIGALFDNLIYALLLKLMQLDVHLVSTFQPLVVVVVLVTFGLIFGALVLINGWRIFRMNALQLSREKASGEKKGRFLKTQTILGLLSLSAGYYLALSVKDPISAIMIFFLAVLLVILGTYLLFNAGITVFLQLLKKNKKYYYQPNNMISVSNLIFRMKKNAVGLATIAILSTMVLVTMSAATNIMAGGEFMQRLMNPHDFSIQGRNLDTEDLDQVLTKFANDHNLQVTQKESLLYATFGLDSQSGNKLTIIPNGTTHVTPKTVFMVMGQDQVKDMIGKELNLSDNQVALYVNSNKALKGQKELVLDGQTFTVAEEFTKDFILDHVPNQYNMLTSDYNYLIVKDVKEFMAKFPQAQIFTELYGGMNVTASKEEQIKLAPTYDQAISDFNAQLSEKDSYVYGSNKVEAVDELNGLLGGIFFIGIFLSIIFMAGTVLVIYYKQISEGYEDRERFIILQKVGLDNKQIKQTINKQVLTVFFLPLIFAFVHLAFAYHMLSLILKILGVLNAGLMLTVTLSICAIFLLVYVAVFLITSRSYRKLVQM